MTMAVTPEIAALVGPIAAKLKRERKADKDIIAVDIAHLLMRVISAARWSNPYDLVEIIRGVGRLLIAAQPKEIVIGNIVRRVLALIRDEIETDSAIATDPIMSSMFSLLATSDHLAKKGQLSQLKKQSSDFRSIVIQGIRDLIDEITNVDEGLEGMTVDLIHENEILLTPSANSLTVMQFLIKARAKRKFTVLVTENFPNDIENSRSFAKKLAEHKIDTVLIPDSAIFAVMSRVGKVIVGANAVFANGGCKTQAGVGSVVECAKERKTPVFAVTGLYKLSPLYPIDREELVEVGNSAKVLDYSDFELTSNVEVITNTLDDYVSPELIDIYLTNVGGFAPSFIYRIVLDNYKTEDNNLD